MLAKESSIRIRHKLELQKGKAAQLESHSLRNELEAKNEELGSLREALLQKGDEMSALLSAHGAADREQLLAQQLQAASLKTFELESQFTHHAMMGSPPGRGVEGSPSPLRASLGAKDAKIARLEAWVKQQVGACREPLTPPAGPAFRWFRLLRVDLLEGLL